MSWLRGPTTKGVTKLGCWVSSREDYENRAARAMLTLRAARGGVATVLVPYAPGALRVEPEDRIGRSRALEIRKSPLIAGFFISMAHPRGFEPLIPGFVDRFLQVENFQKVFFSGFWGQ